MKIIIPYAFLFLSSSHNNYTCIDIIVKQKSGQIDWHEVYLNTTRAQQITFTVV